MNDISKDTLREIANGVFAELGLRGWRLYYGDSEPETLRNKVAAPGTAMNLRFHVHADDNTTAYIIRVRVPPDALTNPARRDDEIRLQLIAGIRRAHFESSTH